MTAYESIQKRSAFTLIELLVVIAIISLLVSILLPSLKQAREVAIQVACLSQLRNVGTAMQMYSQDNTHYPPCYNTRGEPGVTLENMFWQQLLIKYMNDSPKSLVCPKFTAFIEAGGTTVSNEDNYITWFHTSRQRPMYGYNHLTVGCGGWASAGWGCVGNNDGSEKVAVAPDQLVSPAELIMCCDQGAGYAKPPAMFRDPDGARMSMTYFPDTVFHLGGLNVLFCDGRTEWTDFDDEEYWFEDDRHWVNR